ncbi:MAG: PD-(D/E)XK nuclease family protein, partial [Rikenellaceae bacterium]|nr:PD-(D/E)XK nuclease family protein [Rikenellaceae bacterium]
MQGFLAQTAARLYEKYGDEISSLYLLFPSRRAELFFGEALAALAGKPVWQPHTTSIDELMDTVAGQRAGDRVRLITELYKVWSRYHTEDFDSFYYWGEMLLADFDAVDKYLIDARMLFANLRDIKEVDADRTYLTPAQRQVIDGFWESFSLRAGVSTHQEEFLKVWNTLAAVYNEYKTALAGQQLAYTGMMHRTAAEVLHAGGLPEELAGRRYAVIGFNALTECEKKLFDVLRKVGNAEFFWDWDHYWLDNPQHEAGLFMRGNLQRYPESAPLAGGYDNFRQDKKITVVQAPSDTLQCKYLYRLLESLGTPGKET